MYNEIDLDKIEIPLEPPTEEPARQYYFMAKCRQHVRAIEKASGRRPTFFIQTFGCQVNIEHEKKHVSEFTVKCIEHLILKCYNSFTLGG